MHLSILFADEVPTWVTVGGWATALVVAILGPTATWLFTRKRGHYLTVTKERSTSLIDLPQEFKNRTQVAFDGEKIAALSTVLFSVRNAGSESLKYATASLTLGAVTRILAVQVSRSELATAKILEDNKTIQLNIPLLNSHRLYREVLKIEVICDGPISEIKVDGRGENWSVQYQPNSNFMVWAVRVAFLLMLVCWFGVFLALYGIFVLETSVSLGIVPFVTNATLMTWFYLSGRSYVRRDQ